MRGTARIALAAGLLAGAAAAEGLDAEVADAARWVEARGCASGSYRSRALPVVTEVEEAWSFAMDLVGAPPVHWDGRGYVVGRNGRKWELVAFELRTGRELARAKLKGFVEGSSLLVWDNMALVQTSAEQINGYRLERGRLKADWIFRGRRYDDGWRHPSQPVLHDNEVYCFLGDGWLARIRPGARFPSWITKLSLLDRPSRPVVLGPYVFVAGLRGSPFTADAPDDQRVHGKELDEIDLQAFRRSDGSRVAVVGVGQVIVGAGPPALTLAVTPKTVFVGTDWKMLSTGELSSHAMVPLTITKDGASFAGDVGLWSYALPPAHSRRGDVVLSGAPGRQEWRLYRERRFYGLTEETIQPELFRDRVPPTILGDICYFGSWAMDLETDEILWRLPLDRVTFPVVPADGLILVVEEDKVLRAFRERAGD